MYACHVRRYSSAELHLKVRRAGFEIVRSTSFVTLLLPVNAISRRRNNANETFDPAAEFCLPRMIDRAFESVLRFEHVLMRIGLSLPIGAAAGSLSGESLWQELLEFAHSNRRIDSVGQMAGEEDSG